MSKSTLKISRIIARLNVGGPAKHCIWLLGLDKISYNSQLLCGQVEEYENELSIDSINSVDNFDKVDKFDKSKIRFVRGLKRTIGISDLIVFSSILHNLFLFKPDIVHTHTSKAGLHGRAAALIYNFIRTITLKRRAKVVHTFHGHTFHGYFPPWKEMLFRNIEKFLGRFCTDRIIVISSQQYKEICEHYRIAPHKSFRIVPLGLDTELFSQEKLSKHRGEFRKEFNIPTSWKIVALVSRVAAIKNHQMFVNICDQYIKKYDNNICFAIVGGGDHNIIENLKNLIKEKKLEKHILFCGNRSDLARVYSDLDCMALTSFNEGTPLSLLEAFAAKIPCISTRVGGIPDIFGEKKLDGIESIKSMESIRGISINDFDINQYTDELHKLLTDSVHKKMIIDSAYKYVISNHSVESLLNNVNNVYQELYH
ncbi:MAG: glycosyltransferase [Oligoflexia bacterium]|nr:glycosyltransferase [Oligoflexia bacterium]